jgi:hypothetical protein
MIIECGPAHDRRTLSFTLPNANKIGVFVSGGIDSALLYYLLLLEKQKTNSDCDITPLVIFRKEGSKRFAPPIIEKINRMIGIDKNFKRLGNTTLPEPEQVISAVKQAFRLLKMEIVFVGVISNRLEHQIGFDPIPVTDDELVQTPFKHLEKSHIIDLYNQLGITSLLDMTFSCDQSDQTACGSCNGCRERTWGFEQLGLTDYVR